MHSACVLVAYLLHIFEEFALDDKVSETLGVRKRIARTEGATSSTATSCGYAGEDRSETINILCFC